MKRVSEVEIAGKMRPVCLSIKAVKQICQKYGDIDKMLETIQDMDIIDQLTEVIWLLHLMLEQGAQYVKIHEGKSVDTYTQDELEVLFTVHDIDRLYESLTGALSAGSQQEVEVEVGEEKNGKATQG